MALIAPIIYLFGTMFTYLNGAHGDIVLAQPVYVDEYIEADSYVDDGSQYRFEVSEPFDQFIIDLYNNASWDRSAFTFSFTLNGDTRSGLGVYRYSGNTGIYIDVFPNDTRILRYQGANTVSYSMALPWVFDFSAGAGDFVSFFANVGTLYKLVSVPSSVVPENNSANTDFLFSQFFPRENFVAKIGEDAISESPHGFAPFGALFRWLDLNVLNIGDTQVGLMAYGYLYWCAHVLVFDLVFMCATFFITFVDSCFTKFNRSE